MDTLRAARELEQAGLPRPQAEAIVRAARDAWDARRKEILAGDYLDASLDARLWLHTVTIAAIFAVVAAVFRLFD
jgi:hypothetical protein